VADGGANTRDWNATTNVAGVPPAPATWSSPTPPTTAGTPTRDRVALGIGIGAGLLAILLIVFGVIRILNASSDTSDADQARSQTKALAAREQQAANLRTRIAQANAALTTAVESAQNASRSLTDAENTIAAAFDHATNLFNNGDLAGAAAAYQAQAGAVADLDTKLAASRRALSDVERRLADLQRLQRPT
jgi:hypothetical protein